jgi:catechol 2,3-dioxygenase-like lactoylglutathione lyase family enzyme
VIVLGDPPEAWEALGFRVHDDTIALGRERLYLSGRGGGILEVTAPAVGAEDPDDLPLRTGPLHAAEPSAHPNGAFAVDHVVVLTGSLDRTVAALQHAGLDLRRRDERMAFLRLGSYILEVVERGDDPARFWGLVVVVPDPAAVPGAGPVKNAVQPGRRIATVKGLGTALAVMSRRV